MDSVDNIVNLERYVANDANIIEKNWDVFCKIAKKKNVILYGITTNTNLLWVRCNINFSIVDAIDNNVEKQAYLQGQLQRLAQGGNTAQGVVDNRDVLQPLIPDFRYNRLYSEAQRLNDEYRNVLELRAKYARYLQDMYNKTAPHAVNDVLQQ